MSLTPQQPSIQAMALASFRWDQWVARYQPVWTYHRQGWTLDAMAHYVGLSWRIVQRYLQTTTFLECQARHDRDRSILDPYKAILLPGWNRGCRNGAQFFCTIRRQGFHGHCGIMALYVQRMRQA
jgi:hypothetical protein